MAIIKPFKGIRPSLGAALSASPEELASVEGMDASRALLLRLVHR